MASSLLSNIVRRNKTRPRRDAINKLQRASRGVAPTHIRHSPPWGTSSYCGIFVRGAARGLYAPLRAWPVNMSPCPACCVAFERAHGYDPRQLGLPMF